MSLINLFVAARSALAARRQRQRAYAELMSLDDRSLADIGIHRSQIPGIVEGLQRVPQHAHPELPPALAAPVLGPLFADHRTRRI